MEKFSTWRDKGTGISPFMPIEHQKSTFLTKYLVVPVVFIAKLPIFLITVAVYFTVLPLPGIAYFILTTLFGLRTIETTVDGVKRSNVDQINRLKPAVNDVVVVNYISPINGLILAAVSQCSWRSVVILIPSGKGLYVYNIWDILWVTLSTSSTPPQGEAVTDLASFKGKLVYIFAEGTTSNNRCVLPFVSLKLSGLNLDGFNLKTVLLKLSPPGFTTPLPTVTPIGYIQSLLTNLNPKSIVKVKIFNHEKEKSLNLNLAKKDFELNQLNSVGQDLNISLKEKFYIEFLKLNRK